MPFQFQHNRTYIYSFEVTVAWNEWGPATILFDQEKRVYMKACKNSTVESRFEPHLFFLLAHNLLYHLFEFGFSFFQLWKGLPHSDLDMYTINISELSSQLLPRVAIFPCIGIKLDGFIIAQKRRKRMANVLQNDKHTPIRIFAAWWIHLNLIR